MQLILLERVENLGELGDVVQVQAGYARNFLVPTGKAKMATQENIQEVEARRAELEQLARERLDAATLRHRDLVDVRVTISAKAGTEGKLFGSIGTGEIAAALNELSLPIEKREIRLPDGPLRMLGEYEVGVHLHTDIDATITVVVEAEDLAAT
ncbi:MAG: 50S ribosomal protein L9 [Gammaproteobacteria bacterium]|nr:50S ribosomal protein L9 [Gammaproteobacteria bacterium]